MAGMLTDKGADYVAAWPQAIARKLGLSVGYVADAVNAVIPKAGVNQMAFYPARKDSLEQDHAIGVVGNLAPEQAKAVVAELRRIKQEIREAQATNCHYCGQPLNRRGYCEECV